MSIDRVRLLVPKFCCQRDAIFVFAFILLFFCFVLEYLPGIVSSQYKVGSFGTVDFIEYWSSYRLFDADKDPYDPIALLKIQKELDPTRTQPLMMWNPPWTLTLMGFVLRYDFSTAARVWLVMNFLLLLTSGYLIWEAVSGRRETLITSICGGVFFLPAWFSLGYGQVSILVTFGVALLLWSLQKQRFFWGGVGTFFLTLKPYLAYLILILLFHWMVREKNWKLLISFLSIFLLMLLLTFVYSPSAMHFWGIASSRFSPYVSSHGTYTSPFSWKVATLVEVTRTLFARDDGKFAFLLTLLVPGVTAIIFFSYLVFQRPLLHWDLLFPWVLCVSYLTSPYGWIFDQSILIVTQISGLCLLVEKVQVSELKSTFLFLSFFVLQIVALVLSHCCFSWHHQFWWFPLVLLTLWGLVLKQANLRRESSESVDSSALGVSRRAKLS